MPYVNVGARSLFFARSRPEGASSTVVVLVHGVGGSHLYWPRELRRLPQATVLALDLPGHGRSDGPGCETIEGYRDALVGFLDGAATHRVVIVGHSMGGAVALLAALTHPQRVAGLVLIGTGARLRGGPSVLERLNSNSKNVINSILRSAWAESTPEELTRLARQPLDEVSPQVIHADLRACRRFDVVGRLNEIGAPTLVICGQEDHMTPPEYSRQLAENIPGARLLVIENGGHMVALEQAPAVAGAITDYLQEFA
jgi:pimeloyl-ACP methyl ester carboxylesterase